jgi:hypothetical protein
MPSVKGPVNEFNKKVLAFGVALGAVLRFFNGLQQASIEEHVAQSEDFRGWG